jgi:hypothetical protein
MKFSLIQLQESLDLTSVGKLSSTLINSYNLSELLQQVNLHLLKGTSMLTGLSMEDMYIYITQWQPYMQPLLHGVLDLRRYTNVSC